jgi:hypothetical protein
MDGEMVMIPARSWTGSQHEQRTNERYGMGYIIRDGGVHGVISVI